MKLNKIHYNLKRLYEGKSDVDDIMAAYFSCTNEVKRFMKIFKAGYWSVMPFAFGTYDNFALKLNPNNNSIKTSRIIQINNSDGVTVAANMRSFLPLLYLRYIDDKDLIDDHFIGQRVEIEEMTLPYREYVNAEDSLDYFYHYLEGLSDTKKLETHQSNFSQVYLDFWNHYNDTPEQKVYSDLMKKLAENDDFYPKYNDIDYGFWNNRLYSALAQRAYGDLEAEFQKVEKYYWKNLTQTHGFDSVKQDFDIIPSPSSNSYWSLDSILDNFNPELSRTFSKEVLEHPLYDAIQELRVRGRGYMGERHIEAAAILDTEYNDPYGAWDALVTASYWAGQAGSKAIEPMWEAAIYLSEKHNWKEIHEVLVQQYEYYNFYKDKV